MEKIINNNAYSTIKFRDFIQLFPTCLDKLTMATDEQTAEFKKVFTAYFNDYEIGGETPRMFEDDLLDCYNMNIKYYQEYINIYEDKINYLDGYISTIEETNHGQNKDYDLPHKQVSSEEGYLSKMSKNDNSSTYTKKGGVNVVDQKFNYLKKLKNVYKEFVEQFKCCFLLVYSV